MAAGTSYVRLRGLPFSAAEQEIAQWFASAPGGAIAAVRVIFTYNAIGRKSGEAYVELQDPMAAERAAQVLNNRHLGQRYIEVFVSSEGEASQATAPVMQTPQQMGAGPAGGWQGDAIMAMSNAIVRLRGLPFNATAESVVQFFQGHPIPAGIHGVQMVLGHNGRPNGEAYVDFVSEEMADAALEKDRKTIGSRYVEVFRATPDQMAQALSRTNKSNNIAPGSMPGGGGGMQGGGGGGPYAYGPFSMPPAMTPYGAAGPAVMAPGMDSVLKMRGLPYKVTRNDILEFFTGLSVPLNGVHLMYNEREQPTGEAFVEFSSGEDRERAMTKDRQHMGGRYVELFRVSRAEMLQALEQFVGGYMNNNNLQMQMQGGMAAAPPPYGGMYGAMGQSPYGQPAGFMGAPACGGPGAYGAMPHQMPVGPAAMPPGGAAGGGAKAGTIRMRGLPFRASVDDIFRFFMGFQIIPGGIVLGQRDGRPSGEAWVTFANPGEAARAMVMNHKNMGSRYVELFAA
eukprot:CAMPEP_0183378550 /NCGR_PEP_ID=MMETSP0164_2-20130417/124971_1 /TAXON_ID=221442 /ORGANISM="Coccolithus pelagicus ssp braarudi, Strain PLY182g" /LENGTH=510 /DNA_ID=CAMNT_0025556117 /DNA_START=104 /DNA_END=1636 /DNA_ORIENTATION=-